jgi:hypothetical protein
MAGNDEALLLRSQKNTDSAVARWSSTKGLTCQLSFGESEDPKRDIDMNTVILFWMRCSGKAEYDT